MKVKHKPGCTCATCTPQQPPTPIKDGQAVIPISAFSRQRVGEAWSLVAEISCLEDWLSHADGASVHVQPNGRRKVFKPPASFVIHGETADVEFTHVGADRGADGYEIAGWRYEPTPRQAAMEKRRSVRVLVIND